MKSRSTIYYCSSRFADDDDPEENEEMHQMQDDQNALESDESDADDTGIDPDLVDVRKQFRVALERLAVFKLRYPSPSDWERDMRLWSKSLKRASSDEYLRTVLRKALKKNVLGVLSAPLVREVKEKRKDTLKGELIAFPAVNLFSDAV